MGEEELSVLREHFPFCFNKDGSFDIERFKECIARGIKITQEGYELKFLGKNYGRLLASLDTATVIAPDEEHNSKPLNAKSENIYISGDNLDGLKHLLKSYARRIKCIYIDPPYNTGTDDFVYKDSFNFTIDELSEKLSISEESAKRILELAKRGSASHSAWLLFMHPRLILARELLTKDGCIFISIDDNEQANLKLLCDDVFGEENFVGQIVVKSNPRGSQSESHLAGIHDYILAYARQLDTAAIVGYKLPKEIESEYKYIENGRAYRLLGLRQRGGFWRKSERPNLYFPIFVNERDGNISTEQSADFTISVLPIQPSTNECGTWRWSKDKILVLTNELLAKKVHRNGDEVWDIFQKDFLDKYGERRTKTKSLWEEKELNYQNGTIEIKNLLVSGVFNHAKPVYLIKQCVKMLFCEDNDIILDFFSGSATTAHAVMQLNAEDGGKRKFIMVQLPEEVKPNSEAAKAGYKTIDQIGMERIKRAAEMIHETAPLNSDELDLGFKHYTVIEPSKNIVELMEKFEPRNDLFDHSLLEDYGKSTLLATWLVRDGYAFADPEEVDFAGYKGYYIDKSLYLIDQNLSKDAIEGIIARYEVDEGFNPENVVLFGYSFSWTERESLETNLKRLRHTEKNIRINFEVRY